MHRMQDACGAAGSLPSLHPIPTRRQAAHGGGVPRRGIVCPWEVAPLQFNPYVGSLLTAPLHSARRQAPYGAVVPRGRRVAGWQPPCSHIHPYGQRTVGSEHLNTAGLQLTPHAGKRRTVVWYPEGANVRDVNVSMVVTNVSVVGKHIRLGRKCYSLLLFHK